MSIVLPGGLHEAEFERAGLEFGPTESANVDGEVQSLRVEPSRFGHVLVQLEQPSKRHRRHLPLSLARARTQSQSHKGQPNYPNALYLVNGPTNMETACHCCGI